MNEILGDYRTNFLERLITLERDVEDLKAHMQLQNPKLDKLLLMGEDAIVERGKISARLTRIEPTVKVIADGLLFAKIGRKLVAWTMAAVAAFSATIAGALGGWSALLTYFWPPK